MSRRIAAVITAITGDRVVIGEAELTHAKEEHFEEPLPEDQRILLLLRIFV